MGKTEKHTMSELFDLTLTLNPQAIDPLPEVLGPVSGS